MSYVTGAGINAKRTRDYRVTPERSEDVASRILSLARGLGASKLNKCFALCGIFTRNLNFGEIQERFEEIAKQSYGNTVALLSLFTGVTLHRFPNPENNPDKFNSWISNIGGDIIKLDVQTVFYSRRVCPRHFKEIDKYPNNRLCGIAVPVLHLKPEKLNVADSTTCSVQLGSLGQDLKRGRLEDNSPKEKPSKAPKLTTTPARQGANPPLSYRDIVGMTRVGIWNAEPMTDAQMSLVRAALVAVLNKKGKCKDNRGGGPSFLGFTHKAGWILVTCENQKSQDWLVSEIPRCKPWPEAKLSLMKDSELSKPWVATTFIPKTDASSVSEALDTIRYQNEGLYPEHWRVLSEKDDGAGIIAVLSLDEVSVEALRARDFRVSIGFRKVVFRVTGAKEPLLQEQLRGHTPVLTTTFLQNTES